MLSYSATTVINASEDTIWRILTDAKNYPTWDPGVLRIEGTPRSLSISKPRARWASNAMLSTLTTNAPGARNGGLLAK